MADCWTTRREADPLYDNHRDHFNPPDCGHPECSKDMDAAIDCIVRRMDSLCVLGKGHEGPHEFGAVMIEFPALSGG